MQPETIEMVKSAMSQFNQEIAEFQARIDTLQQIKNILAQLLVDQDEEMSSPDKLLHWTKLPENRRKMLRVIRAANAARQLNA